MKSVFERVRGDAFELRRETLWKFYHQARTSDFVYKVAETFATRVFLVGLSLVTSVIIARILGPEGRGQYATAIVIGGIGAQFGNFGLHASNTYLVAQNRSLLSALLANSLVVSLGLGGLGALVTWWIFAIWPTLAPIQGMLLALSLIWIPFTLAYMLLQNLQLGIQEVRSYNSIALFTKLLSVALLGSLILLHLVTVETVFASGFLIVLISCAWTFWKLWPHLTWPLKLSKPLFVEGIHYGFKAYLAAFFGFLVLRVDLLLVKQMLGSEQAGYYSTAANMADLMYMLPSTIGVILFPRMAALKTTEEKWALAVKASLGTGALMILLAVGGFLFARPAIQLLYGKAFLPAVAPFYVLALAMVFYGVNNIIANYFAAIGFPNFAVYIWVPMALLNIVLNLVLIPGWGIVGAAAASLVCYLMILVCQYIYASRQVSKLHAS